MSKVSVNNKTTLTSYYDLVGKPIICNDDDAVDSLRYLVDNSYANQFKKYIKGQWDVFDPKNYTLDDLYYVTSSDHPSFRDGQYRDRYALCGREMIYSKWDIQQALEELYACTNIYKDDIEIELNPITLFSIFKEYPEDIEMYHGVPTFEGFGTKTTYLLPYDVVYIHCKELKIHRRLALYIPGYNNAKENYEGDEIEMKLPKKYIVNSDAAILIDNNDKKTIVKRHKEDRPDPVKGFLWAYFIKNSGLTRTKANQYLEKIKEDYIDEVSKKKKQNKNKKKKTR